MKTFRTRLSSFFRSAWTWTRTFAMKHKIVSAIIVLLIVGGGYAAYAAMSSTSGGTEYVLGRVTKGSLEVTVTDSGQVSAQDTLNLVPKASGQITKIYVKPGQTVKAGALIATLDMTTAAQAVTSAKQNLEAAQISYQQTVSSSNGSVASDQTSVQTAQTNAANALTTIFTNLPAVMQGIDSTLHNLSTVPGYTVQQNIDAYLSYVNTAQARQYHDQVALDFIAARAAYDKAQQEFAGVDPNTLSVTQTEDLAADTQLTTKAITTEIKDTLTFYNYVNQQVISGQMVAPPQLASQISTLTTYQNTVSGDQSSLASAASALQNAEQSLQQDSQSSSGASVSLTVQSAQLNVQKAQTALAQAEEDESDYVVRAPFDGVIATVPVNQYDQGSSGTTIATLITTEEYVDLSLNETDAATVAEGQKASFTFDAIDGLTLNGTVAEVSPIGTVSQGVATYDVKVGFDTQDARVKPGMTAEATIITNSVDDAIQVPASAITTTNGTSYVQVATLKNASSTAAGMGMASGTRARVRTGTASSTAEGYAGMGASFGVTSSSTGSSTARAAFASRTQTVGADEVTIIRVPVVIGISNDTMTQVTSGLQPGQMIVTSSTKGSTSKTAASSSGLFGLFGGNTTRRTTGTTGTGGFTRTTGSTGAAGARTTGGTGGFSGPPGG